MEKRQIWIYSHTDLPYLIVKRTAFSFQIPTMDSAGYLIYSISQGILIDEPAWETVYKHGPQTFGIFSGRTYEISDIS